MREDWLIQRSKAAFYGAAVGDALGKMTEGYWPPEIKQKYGDYIKNFATPVQPSSDFSWSYAEITDDTRFAVLVAESIAFSDRVEEKEIVRRILEKPIKGWPRWKKFRKIATKGKEDTGTGNGAPTRVTSIGIIHPPSNLKQLVLSVSKACSCTHNTQSALSAACAIAAAFSAAIEDFDKEAVFEIAIEAAELGKKFGEEDLCPDVASRLRCARRAIEELNLSIGNLRRMGFNPGFQAWEGASFAMALVLLHDSSKDAVLAAVSQGGDADSIASMAGGILAAKFPYTLPEEWVQVVKRENTLNLDELVERLVKLREANS